MKLIFSIFIFFGLTIVANAGFLSSLLGSVVANDLSKSSRNNMYLSPDRAKKINTYLWNMHKSKKYDKQ